MKVVYLFALVLAGLSMTGCSTVMTSQEEYSKRVTVLASSYQKQNEKIAQSVGERVLDKNLNEAFSAFVIALPELGLIPKTVDRNAGFISAEGPIPTSDGQFREDLKGLVNDMTRVTGFSGGAIMVSQLYIVPAPDKSTLCLTVAAKQLAEGKTRVRLMLSGKGNPTRIMIDQSYLGDRDWDVYKSFEDIYPPLHLHVLEAIWRKVDRQLFLDKNIDR